MRIKGKWMSLVLAVSMTVAGVPAYANEAIDSQSELTAVESEIEIAEEEEIEIQDEEIVADPPREEVTMYRLYNMQTGEHLYTADKNEKRYLSKNGWDYEGIAFIVPAVSEHPVYRLYNMESGDHHYTKSKRERNYLLKYGWSDEGIGWYSAEEYDVPVYRQYNPKATMGAHNYTVSKRENKVLTTQYGWIAEGIAFYAIKAK